MQVQGAGVSSQAVLSDSSDTEDSCAMVHMSDTLPRPAEVRVGHCRPIPKVQLDIRPHRVSLWTMRSMVNLPLLKRSGILRSLCHQFPIRVHTSVLIWLL